MSVNSKMTAIADKIRALLGISGTMGLDAMAANLATEQTNVTNAFTSISGKGGTVPSAKVSGNLVTAINSIPSGVTVRKKSGTVTTNYNGQATVSNLGFLPDIVIFDAKSETRYQGYAGAMFEESGLTTLEFTILPSNTTTHLMSVFNVTRSSSGFSLKATKLDYSLKTSADANRSISYTAIKYT